MKYAHFMPKSSTTSKRLKMFNEREKLYGGYGQEGAQTGSTAETTPAVTPPTAPTTYGDWIKSQRGQSNSYGEAVSSIDKYAQTGKVQAQVNYARNKATYGSMAESLGQSGLTGSGYANYINDQAERVKYSDLQSADETVKEKQKALYSDYLNNDAANAASQTFTLTDGNGNSQTITTDSLGAVDNYINEGTITSASELQAVRNSLSMTDAEYTARAQAIYDKNYAPLATEYESVSAGSDSGAVQSFFSKIDNEYAQGKISQAQYQDFYFKDNKKDIDELAASQNTATVKSTITADKNNLGDAKYNELIKLLEEKEKSLLENEQRQGSLIANSVSGGGMAYANAGMDIANAIKDWFKSKKK